MPSSLPRLEPGPTSVSGPTLDCFTGAILVKEGPAAIGSTYLRESSLSLPTATERAELPPYRATPPPLPSPIYLVQPGPSTRGRKTKTTPSPRDERKENWPLLAAFALGTATVALTTVFVEPIGLGLSAVAAFAAGLVTLGVAFERGASSLRRRDVGSVPERAARENLDRFGERGRLRGGGRA